MKTSITKIFTFEAAHQLPNHSGKCAHLHGHSYRLEVTVTGEIIKEGTSEGMVLDFSDMGAVVESEVLSKWDHKYLNDLVDFVPTAELLAAEIFKRLKSAGLNVIKVNLWETPKAFATVEI
jgi:6-pyruvoyltetrahydropterin/6-carboxytetrahydropterin synthase